MVVENAEIATETGFFTIVLFISLFLLVAPRFVLDHLKALLG